MNKPIRINGVDCDPSKMDISIQTVSSPDAGRDQLGFMHVEYIATKYKIELEWLYPSPAKVKAVLAAIKPSKSRPFFPVVFIDPVTNEEVTKNMYVGDRSVPYQMWGTNRKFFSRMAFSLIEI